VYVCVCVCVCVCVHPIACNLVHFLTHGINKLFIAHEASD